MRQFCQEEGLLYVRDDDSIRRPFDEPPIVANYFFHEEIIPFAKRRQQQSKKVLNYKKLYR